MKKPKVRDVEDIASQKSMTPVVARSRKKVPTASSALVPSSRSAPVRLITEEDRTIKLRSVAPRPEAALARAAGRPQSRQRQCQEDGATYYESTATPQAEDRDGFSAIFHSLFNAGHVARPRGQRRRHALVC